MILNGWKEIASHLGRGVRTVQRWEQWGLPVRRPNSKLRSAVICTTEELDAWLAACQNGRPTMVDANDNAEDPATRKRVAQVLTNAAIVRRNATRLRLQLEQIHARAELRKLTRAARANQS